MYRHLEPQRSADTSRPALKSRNPMLHRVCGVGVLLRGSIWDKTISEARITKGKTTQNRGLAYKYNPKPRKTMVWLTNTTENHAKRWENGLKRAENDPKMS